ncbi:MAG: M20/M25/M40 family metallo-hydrolase, partial [Alphaproteobacteria bacterium]
MKKLFLGLGVALVGLAAIVLWRAMTLEPTHYTAEPWAGPAFDENVLAEELGAAIRFRTISRQDGVTDDDAFAGFYRWMDRTYPNIAPHFVEAFSWSRIYKIEGSDPSLQPLLIMGHIDVVPVVPGTEKDWLRPPYAGEVAEGYLWGRGALDMKGPTIMMLHALNAKLATGFTPERPIYLAIHHDEEIGGQDGAVAIAKWLKDNNIRPKLAFDEGGLIAAGLVPGVESPVAMIGVGEKGYLTLEIVAPGNGGHSSTPPRETAVGKLARAITRLENAPFPGGLEGPVATMYETLGAEMSFGQKLMIANLWLFRPVLEAVMSEQPSADATLRTTIAPTMLEGSPKENVLAIKAKAMVNFRVHPRDTIDGVIERVKQVIADPDITVHIPADGWPSEPSPFSDTNGPVWGQLTTTIAEVWPDLMISPSLTVGATDSRHYREVSDNVYRFAPFT